jgi:hypothetical protein
LDILAGMNEPQTKLVTVRDGTQPLDVRQCRLSRLPDGREAALWQGRLYPLLPGDVIDAAGEAFIEPVERPHPQSRPTVAVVGDEMAAYVLIAGDAAERDHVAKHLREQGAVEIRRGRWLGDPVDGVVADWFIRIEPPEGFTHQSLLAGLTSPAVTNLGSSPEAMRLRVLRTELAILRARAETLLSENRTLRSVGETTEAELAALRELLAEQVAALGKAEAEASASTAVRPQSQPPPRRLRDEVGSAIATLLPHLELLRDSLEVAAGEFRERTHLYRALSELPVSGGMLPPTWKSLRGGSRFRERHVSTGDSDSGRLYAKFEEVERRWRVLISDKAEQGRDIVWLERHAR